MSQNEDFNWRSFITVHSILYLIFGVMSAIVAFKCFMIPNHFMDGGINGISILLHEVFHINIAIPLLILNLPFIIIGYKKIGKSFAYYSFIAIILLILGLQFIDLPVVTDDKFLIAIFGGLFIGLGIGLVIRGGAAIDGLEILAVYANRNSKFSIKEIILFINGLLFLSVAYFIGLENCMYSMVTFFTAVNISNFVVDGFEEYTSLTVFSAEYETLISMLMDDYGKALSVYKGKRGYLPGIEVKTHADLDIIVVVVTRLEIFSLQRAIMKVDPNAFIYIQSVKEVQGGIIKQLRKH